ncbi:MAG: threonine synthase, partial [Salinivirgaceae bacterium]|nr:threonine synthase [Salinivirgaceae bacterium]
QKSIATIANAMDVGDPSNFARVIELFGKSVDNVRAEISSYSYTDEQIGATMAEVLKATGYELDPHGAVGYSALRDHLNNGELGLFLETAHPAKFIDTVEKYTGKRVEIPARLQKFAEGTKQTVKIKADYTELKNRLLQ